MDNGLVPPLGIKTFCDFNSLIWHAVGNSGADLTLCP